MGIEIMETILGSDSRIDLQIELLSKIHSYVDSGNVSFQVESLIRTHNAMKDKLSLFASKQDQCKDDTEELKKSLQYCTTLLATCLLYTSPSPRDATLSRMPSSA
eukprot:TRINITY_DN6062_c0_g1_i2.p1 TRINITY_DN6062_c0_g1~~TRINITY_DN6062_c0_g1_i2.p1  ORF type:complete len:123 (+),score=32.37 TRINITY_DN6062_c0_g1_i2:56-370(+)